MLASFGDAGTAATGTYLLVLAAFAAVFLAATALVLARTTARTTR